MPHNMFYNKECVNILGLVGNTPLIKLQKIVEPYMANVWVKLEYYNPTGSHKDRIALFMICRALENGLVKPGGIVVEASTGNTGVSIAYISMLLGLKAIIVVPKNISEEKKRLMRLFGAELIEVPVTNNPQEYIEEAKKIARELRAYYIGQYDNPANPEAHYRTTAPEIWRQLNGCIDAFVMGIGTGGTLSGVARYLKERKKNVLIVAVEPEGSIVSKLLRGEKATFKPHVIEGLTGFDIPSNLDTKLIDRYITVSQKDAIVTCYKLLRQEGLFVGPSTGANVYAALQVAKELGSGKNVVTIAADTGYKYLTSIYNEKWLKQKLGLDLENLIQANEN